MGDSNADDPFCSINPYWKLSLVFKCLTDTIMLDDFKTELRKLGFARLEREEARRKSVATFANKESFVANRSEVEEVDPVDGSPRPLSLSEMLTGGEQLPTIGNGRRNATSRPAIGRAGTKIKNLPSLHNPWGRSTEGDS